LASRPGRRYTAPSPLRAAPAAAQSRTRPDETMKTTLAKLRWLPGFLYRHPVLTFVVMGATFILFGLTSVNLYMLLAANVGLVIEYGTQALADGALEQLADLLGSTVLATLLFLLFMLCERTLVRRLTGEALRGRGPE
jgi:hypothetical protein